MSYCAHLLFDFYRVEDPCSLVGVWLRKDSEIIIKIRRIKMDGSIDYLLILFIHQKLDF